MEDFEKILKKILRDKGFNSIFDESYGTEYQLKLTINIKGNAFMINTFSVESINQCYQLALYQIVIEGLNAICQSKKPL